MEINLAFFSVLIIRLVKKAIISGKNIPIDSTVGIFFVSQLYKVPINNIAITNKMEFIIK